MLTGLLPGSHVQLSYTIQDRLPGSGSAHSCLGFPTLIFNQESTHRFAYRQSDGGDPSTQVPSSCMTLAIIKLTKIYIAQVLMKKKREKWGWVKKFPKPHLCSRPYIVGLNFFI